MNITKDWAQMLKDFPKPHLPTQQDMLDEFSQMTESCKGETELGPECEGCLGYFARQAIRALIEPSGEKAKTIIEKDSGPRQRCSGCGRQAADDPTFPDDYCVKCWPDHKALLRDKLQSWPGDMALSSDDIADLFALIESSGEKGRIPSVAGELIDREWAEDEEQPAPSPGPSSSIEGYPASVKQALTVPAPLPAEAEEAMDIMGEFDNLVSSCHGGYIETDPEFKPCFEGCIPGIDAIRNALKAQLASNRLTVQYANAPTIKKDLTVAPLPAEVEEAMDTLRVFGMSGASETGDIPASEREILAALAVIRAALALREEKK